MLASAHLDPTYLGRSADAVDLARAARSGTRGVATHGVTAHFHATEARALAVGGDAAGAGKALNSAVRVFEERNPGTDPDWISYFNDAELSAEFSHCFRDLGRNSDALTYSQRAISGTSARSDFFAKMVGAMSQVALLARALETWMVPALLRRRPSLQAANSSPLGVSGTSPTSAVNLLRTGSPP
ncbi:hypothetical protein GCM10009789_28600 [Kribbella sancticallisti]|uniref:Uncharacterized protein n=1 Tax=Kribbella sancticallisti TaxID=460087 RepID=A0ABP4P7W7_9ACTN